MAASRSTQLEDRMSCGVCMETFDDNHVPKLLPCQHTFCEVCIRQSASQYSFPPSLDCPICRCKHVIPQGGFVTNRAVLDIVEEFMKDTPRNVSIPLKCKKHSNKDVILVCIDCLDVLCNTCIKSSVHLKAEHHVEEVEEAAPALQQKFKESQRSYEKKLSMIEDSHCSSTEMAKVVKDITSFAKKLHAEINTWENDQLVFMNKLQQRKTAVQNGFDKSLKTLLDNLTTEIQQKSTIQSSFLKEVGTVLKLQQEIDSKIPKGVKVLFNVEAIESNFYDGLATLAIQAGDVIAVTEEVGGRYLHGINIATSQEGEFCEKCVKRIQ